MSAAIEIEGGYTPPGSLGIVSLGTTGRLVHLARYGEQVTSCLKIIAWPSEIQESMTGRLCPACATAEDITSTDDWEQIW